MDIVRDMASDRNTASFASFYEAEHRGQVRSATLILGSRELAHDVVHDAFTRVLVEWDRIELPGPYLNRCVVNGCRDVLRHRRVRDRFLRTRRPGDVDQSTHEIDVGLFDALDRLPFNQRAAVVLRFYLQLTENEIAEHLGCRPGSVGPWIRRGLDRLAQEFTKEP